MTWPQLILTILSAVIPVAVAVFVWGSTQVSRLRMDAYQRKEAHYVELVKALNGFNVASQKRDTKAHFLQAVRHGRRRRFSTSQSSRTTRRRPWTASSSGRRGSCTEMARRGDGIYLRALRQTMSSPQIIGDAPRKPGDCSSGTLPPATPLAVRRGARRQLASHPMRPAMSLCPGKADR
jgi:hypothetical protein